MIYLDAAATSPPAADCRAFVQEVLSRSWANPSSPHAWGLAGAKLLQQAREAFAAWFQVPLEGVIFCASGSEAINLAIKGSLAKGGEILISSMEHPAVEETAKALEQQGCRLTRLAPVPQTGQVDLGDLQAKLGPQVKLVSIQQVNNETGVIQPLEAIAQRIKQFAPQALFHVDGVQGFGKLPLVLPGVDLYSLSGHKLGALPGAGVLIRRKPVPLAPLIHGGGQEWGLRSGTENLPALASLAWAAGRALGQLQRHKEQATAWQDSFLRALAQGNLPFAAFTPPERSPYILQLGFSGVLGEVLVNHLSQQGILVGKGSACQAKAKKISFGLKALGWSDQRIKEGIRISLSHDWWPPEPEIVAKAVLQAASELKRMLA